MKFRKSNLAALAAMLMLAGCGAEPISIEADEEEIAAFEEYNVASLKGPTSMGMVKLMADNEIGSSFNTYDFSIYATADEIVAGVLSGETDIANIPANLAAVLYKKTEGSIYVADVNTLGVLYLVSSGEQIGSVSDLKGKTIYSTGKSTTPEYVLNYILRQNGLEPQKDVIIEYRTEAAEAAAMLAESENALAVLPQPYVSSAQAQNDAITVELSLTDEWNRVSDTPLITGVTIAQKSSVDKNMIAFDAFLDEYADSVSYVFENTETAASMIEDYGIIKKEIAIKALPQCNITLLRNEEMKQAVLGYWNVLFDADSSSVGGSIPDDAVFYFSDEQS